MVKFYLIYRWFLTAPLILLCNDSKDWLPRQFTARTIVDSCAGIELKVIYVGNFPCWKDEVSLMRKEKSVVA